jgi:hypothetical protein
MTEAVEEFAVHRFVRDLFEDLNLTLPALGCAFEGTMPWSALTGRGSLQSLRNKLFLYFADLATKSATLSVTCRPSVQGSELGLDFVCVPFVALWSNLPAWDSTLFHALPDGSGFGIVVSLGAPPDLGPPVNWQRLAELYEGAAPGRQMLDQFVVRSAVLVGELEKAIGAGDANGVFRAAHTLKGSSRGVAALPLADAALQLEMLGRRGELSTAADLYKAFKVAYDDFVATVRRGP